MKVTITQTQDAVLFYIAAAENARAALEDKIKKDEQYDKFCRKHFSSNHYSVLFHSHSSEFIFYDWKDLKTIDYFTIIDNKIVYSEKNTFDGVEKIAQELLDIVKKFY